MKETIQNRIDQLDYIKIEGKPTSDIDEMTNQLKELNNQLSTAQMLITNPTGYNDFADSVSDYLMEREKVNDLNLGQRALLALYCDLYPNRFSRDDIDKKIYEIQIEG